MRYREERRTEKDVVIKSIGLPRVEHNLTEHDDEGIDIHSYITA